MELSKMFYRTLLLWKRPAVLQKKQSVKKRRPLERGARTKKPNDRTKYLDDIIGLPMGQKTCRPKLNYK